MAVTTTHASNLGSIAAASTSAGSSSTGAAGVVRSVSGGVGFGGIVLALLEYLLL